MKHKDGGLIKTYTESIVSYSNQGQLKNLRHTTEQLKVKGMVVRWISQDSERFFLPPPEAEKPDALEPISEQQDSENNFVEKARPIKDNHVS